MICAHASKIIYVLLPWVIYHPRQYILSTSISKMSSCDCSCCARAFDEVGWHDMHACKFMRAFLTNQLCVSPRAQIKCTWCGGLHKNNKKFNLQENTETPCYVRIAMHARTKFVPRRTLTYICLYICCIKCLTIFFGVRIAQKYLFLCTNSTSDKSFHVHMWNAYTYLVKHQSKHVRLLMTL